MKGRALRRALETPEGALRVSAPLPLIQDTTELVTPALAEEWLTSKNRNNRPVNWRKVEEYAARMTRGEWVVHGQGIMFDSNGVLLTGQQRLWGVVYSGVSIYFRISRGNPPDSARFIDRGRAQSARDLATRETERAHSPTEAALARVVCLLSGDKPSVDALSQIIIGKSEILQAVLEATETTKKTRAILMVLGVICTISHETTDARNLAEQAPVYADRLTAELRPETPEKLWGKGAAFKLALKVATRIIEGNDDNAT